MSNSKKIEGVGYSAGSIHAIYPTSPIECHPEGYLEWSASGSGDHIGICAADLIKIIVIGYPIRFRFAKEGEDLTINDGNARDYIIAGDYEYYQIPEGAIALVCQAIGGTANIITVQFGKSTPYWESLQ